MAKRLWWREFLLLCLPITALGAFLVFSKAKNFLPPRELRMDSVRFVEPTVLERYEGYEVALEVKQSAPPGNSQWYEYELTNGEGKIWSWRQHNLEWLEVSNGGMTQSFDSRFSSRNQYRTAFWSQRLFQGGHSVRFSWFTRQNNGSFSPPQSVDLEKPDFNLPHLQKPTELPFQVSKIEWAPEPGRILKSTVILNKIQVWTDSPPGKHPQFLRDWHFVQNGSDMGRFGIAQTQWGKDKDGVSRSGMEILYHLGQKATSARGRLSIDGSWPVEITLELPKDWQNNTKPFEVKFKTRVADLPTREQLYERNDWWQAKALLKKGNFSP